MVFMATKGNFLLAPHCLNSNDGQVIMYVKLDFLRQFLCTTLTCSVVQYNHHILKCVYEQLCCLSLIKFKASKENI